MCLLWIPKFYDMLEGIQYWFTIHQITYIVEKVRYCYDLESVLST